MKRTRNKKTIPEANVISYDISEEPIVLSKHLIETLLAVDSNCLTLYIFYYYTAKWQKTNQPKCTIQYAANGLGWGVQKVRSTKKLLIEMGLVLDVVKRNDHCISGHYIHVKFIWKTSSKSYPIKNSRVDSYPIKKLQGRKLIGKCLKEKYIINKKIIIKKDLPFSYFKEYLPSTFLENKTFLESLNDYITHRINLKVPLTELAIKKLSNKFKKFKIEEVIQALDDSVETGKWSGVYPKSKNSFKTTGKNTYKEENKTYRKSDITV